MANATTVSLEASMYFKLGSLRRPGVQARTCFDAVLSGERTSTTRFSQDGGAQFDRWSALKPGDLVRLFDKPWTPGGFSGRSCIVRITEAPTSIDLRLINPEQWSMAEAWSTEFITILLRQGRSKGLQIRYALHDRTGSEDPQAHLALF